MASAGAHRTAAPSPGWPRPLPSLGGSVCPVPIFCPPQGGGVRVPCTPFSSPALPGGLRAPWPLLSLHPVPEGVPAAAGGHLHCCPQCPSSCCPPPLCAMGFWVVVVKGGCAWSMLRLCPGVTPPQCGGLRGMGQSGHCLPGVPHALCPARDSRFGGLGGDSPLHGAPVERGITDTSSTDPFRGLDCPVVSTIPELRVPSHGVSPTASSLPGTVTAPEAATRG